MAFTGIPRELAEWVDSMHLSPYALIAVLTVVYLILGTALDGISMIVLTAAVVLPMIQKAGFDLIWFGIFIVLLVEIAEVTPPVGFNLFVLQNMTGKDSNTIARAAIPFFACLVVCIALITVFAGDRDLAAGRGDGRRSASDAAGAAAGVANWRRQVAHFGHCRPRVGHHGPAFRKACARPWRTSPMRPAPRTAMADLSTPLSWKAQPGPADAAGAAPAADADAEGQGQPRRLPVADAALRQLSGAERADRDAAVPDAGRRRTASRSRRA